MKNIPSATKKTNHIRLHRFVRLGDRADSQVFTFVVPAQLTRGFINSAQSKEFKYGGQRWQLLLCYQLEDVITSDRGLGSTSIERSKSTDASSDLNSLHCPPLKKILSNPLNVGIELCGGLAGMHCKLESCRFTVLNRDSISRNKTYEEKLFTFTADNPTYWKTDWLQVDRLAPEGFLFDDWTWLLEVELRGASTIYEECLSVSKMGTKKSTTNGKLRLESATFTYASSDWNVSLEWLTTEAKKTDTLTNNVPPVESRKAEKVGCPTLKLHRHSRTNHWCRVRYRATLVWGNLGESTVEPTDQLITSDSGASTTGYEIGDPKWFVKGIQQVLSGKQRIKIVIEMLVAAPVSRIDLIPIAPLGGENLARCRDPDGHDWIVLSDILGTLVRLKFFPVVEVYQHDGVNLYQPTDRPCESRCVSWNVHLIPFQSARGVVRALSSTYVCHVPKFRCLARANSTTHGPLTVGKEVMIQPEEVVEVALDLPVEHVCDKNAGYVHPTDNTMTIRIEWLQSQMLGHAHYTVYDDMLQSQRNQLWRELWALQAENSALKRQLLAAQATVSSPPDASCSSSLTPVPPTSKKLYFSQSSDMLPKTSTFVRSASDSHHPGHSALLKAPGPTPPFSSPSGDTVYKQFSLRLPKNSSTEEGSYWRPEEAPRSIHRRSSVNVLLDGKPRRSLPTFSKTSWHLQRRQCQVEEDDDDDVGCSDGHISCGDNSIFLTVNNVQCVHSNLSSPARRPLPRSCESSSGPSPQNALSPSHSSSTASTPCGLNLSRSPAREYDSRPQ